MSATDRDHRLRSRRETVPQAPSPLDPFLRRFLNWVVDQPQGLNPPRDLQTISEALDWQPSFVEVLFTAARSRGLLKPMPARGSRAKMTWQVSDRGAYWLGSNHHHTPNPNDAA
jgi:hypothetical protein